MDRDNLRQILLSLLKDAVERPPERGAIQTAGDGAATGGSQGSSIIQSVTSEAVARLIVASGSSGSESTGPRSSGADTSAAAWIQRLTETAQKQAESVEENTKALKESTLERAAGVAAAIRGTAGGGAPGLSVLASPLASLASGLARLLGGRGEREATPLVRYSRPPELSLQAGVTGPERAAAAIDHDLDGRPRPVRVASTPQVTVNVQAMDSRSFVDHSDDIARAVREAILNSHSLNELLTDL